MTLREKFLAIQTYEEFDRRREEFKDIPADKEILQHMDKIFPPISNPDMELYKTPGSHCPGK